MEEILPIPNKCAVREPQGRAAHAADAADDLIQTQTQVKRMDGACAATELTQAETSPQQGWVGVAAPSSDGVCLPGQGRRQPGMGHGEIRSG